MPDKHSLFSASNAHCWLLCAGALALAQGKPNGASLASATGTVAHTLLEENLRHDKAPDAFLGRVFQQDGFDIEVDEEMVDRVQIAIDNIREVTAGALLVMPERRVNYAKLMGVPEEQAWGTSDVIAVLPDELQVHDYKDGYKAVSAEDNPQMKLYAGGALMELADLLDEMPKRVRMFIHQPKVSAAPSEWSCTVDELLAWFKEQVTPQAQRVKIAFGGYIDKDPAWQARWADEYLTPGPSQCQWCKAKATCPKLRAEVAEFTMNAQPATPEEFAEEGVATAAAIEPQDADWLAAALVRVDLIEDWCKAIRAEAERRLLGGELVPGFKVVQGKRGARAWSSADEAEKLLRGQFRLTIEQAFNLKLVSPPQAEKLVKAGVIGERQWKKAQALIVQPEGKLHVAPENDPRPAVAVEPVANDFQPINEEDDIT